MGNSSSSSQKSVAAEGQKYLADIATKPGVHTLPSGMRFKIVRKVEETDNFMSPNATDPCSVHYHGTLPNGKVFDSSMNTGTPATFAPNQVIAGWTEALQYMSEGEEWEVYLPPGLAYGPRGAGNVIPPNATLTFKIRLLKVLQGGKEASAGHKMLEGALGMAYVQM